MKLFVDKSADTLYLRLDDSLVTRSENASLGVSFDFNGSNEIVGIELSGLSNRSSPLDLSKIELHEGTSAQNRKVNTPSHYHVHLRTPEGGERVIPNKYRSLTSAMRTVKQLGEYVEIDGVRREDFTTNMEPCGDGWSSCRYSSN